jgi:hypothetical protein
VLAKTASIDEQYRNLTLAIKQVGKDGSQEIEKLSLIRAKGQIM